MEPENAANGAGGSSTAVLTLRRRARPITSCPISLEVMHDPVIVVQSGIIYERALIEEALSWNKFRDPKTNQQWSEPLTITPNVLVRKMIREWHEQPQPPPQPQQKTPLHMSPPRRSTYNTTPDSVMSDISDPTTVPSTRAQPATASLGARYAAHTSRAQQQGPLLSRRRSRRTAALR